MLAAPIPLNDDLRLEDLYSFNILDSEPENDFDDLVGLVSQICGCPIASITFVDKNRQWFKAEKNMQGKEGNREDSFCGHAIAQQEIFVVNDARNDQRFFDNPHVTGGIKIGFYAGAPIVSSSGYTLGTVCAIDNSPRKLTDQQLNSLQSIARQVSRLLDLRLKNKQILETAEKLIQAEKKIAQLNITNRDEENFQTASLLHEDIAQTTAAVKMYMNFAKDGKDLSGQFLEYGIEEIDNLRQSITQLSRSIAPTTLELDSYAGFIEDMLVDFGEKHKAATAFECNDDNAVLNGYTGLMIFRIVQDLIRLAKYAGADNISLSIDTGKMLDVLFQYNELKAIPVNRRMLVESNIDNRIDMLKGTVERSSAAGSSFTRLNIPIG